MQSSSHKTYWLDSLLITVVLGFFYQLFLGHYALIAPDGARYSEIAREMVKSGHYLVPRLNHILYFEKPPLFYWMEALSIQLFGLGEWALRLWPVILAISGALLTYVTGHRFYDRKTGLYASFILATSLLYFAMGHLITLDMAVSTFVTATLLLFLLGTREEKALTRRFYFWSAACCAALAVLTKGLIGLLFPAMVIGLWIVLQNRWRELKRWYLPSSILLFFLIAIPWHLFMQLHYPMFFHFYFIEQHFARYATLSASRYEPFYFYSATFLLGFFPWSAFVIQAFIHGWKNRHASTINTFLFIWFFAILIFFSFSQSQLIPYILPIFPPAALLTANYLTHTTEKTPALTIGFTLLMLLAIAACVALLIIPHYYPTARPLLAKKQLAISGITLLITTFVCYCFFWFRHFNMARITLVLGTALVSILLLLAIPYIDHRSLKPLTNLIMVKIRSGDEVVAFGHYYQDLPFYTRQRVTVVDCLSELDFGVKYEDASDWMIQSPQFWRRWHSPRRLFVVTRLSDYRELVEKYPDVRFYVLGKTERNILFSNQDNTSIRPDQKQSGTAKP